MYRLLVWWWCTKEHNDGVQWMQEECYVISITMANVGYHKCSILKFSTQDKCHFGCPISFIGGHFTKMCSTKFPPFTVKASPKFACHNDYNLHIET